MRKKIKQIVTLTLLLATAISLLAASFPSYLEDGNRKQIYKEMDLTLANGGSEAIEYVGPPSPRRYSVSVKPSYPYEKPIIRDPRIIFGLFDGIRPFHVDFYYII